MSTASTTQEFTSLANAFRSSGELEDRFIEDAVERIPLKVLLEGSTLYGRGEELQGRSVLLATHAQLTTAAALLELDGIARRVVLCPPELPIEHLPYVMETAEVDGIVSDRAMTHLGKPRPLYFCPCTRKMVPRENHPGREVPTEWILLTSGTTGLPKLVVHTLASLCASITPQTSPSGSRVCWSTFYDMRRYGGLQIFLRALLTGASLVLNSQDESISDFLIRAGRSGVTHISGTPSHWRRALMSPSAGEFQPQYIRLSGETADQGILNHLSISYPNAHIVHAFASTEAGVAFEVHDGLAGFPYQVIEQDAKPELKVEDGTLRIRSKGAAEHYLGDDVPHIKDEDGFVDTRDLVEQRNGRFYFAGRRDGVINVGGFKVYPEEVEQIISRHPEVNMCLVRARKSAITGAVVVADVVLRPASSSDRRDPKGAQDDILQLCREMLPSHKVPAAINIVPMLIISGAGKVMRQNA